MTCGISMARGILLHCTTCKHCTYHALTTKRMWRRQPGHSRMSGTYPGWTTSTSSVPDLLHHYRHLIRTAVVVSVFSFACELVLVVRSGDGGGGAFPMNSFCHNIDCRKNIEGIAPALNHQHHCVIW